MPDDAAIRALVARARDGDGTAWNELVERFAPLVWSICRKYRLTDADADDVGQTVWLRLVERLGAVRDPAALAGWLGTTTQRECLRVLRLNQRLRRVEEAAQRDPTGERTGDPGAPIEDWLLEEERNAALRAAFALLPPSCQELLSLLVHDPPLSYAEISGKLGMKIGGLGPRRGRCLEKLRHSPPLAELVESAVRRVEMR